ncbi:MAG: periplasmic heavy metal sensor [Aestuariivirga sp.]|nr:periplasmic heavy metal sensor [Aestuariivirga sp.]
MSDTGTAVPPPVSAPARSFPWLKAALIASLAVNLLFIGAGVARFLVKEPSDRISGLSQVQLIPRKFFGELEGARKAELLGVFRDMRPAFREGRRAAREDIALLAAALEAEPYDAARVRAAVEGFTTRSERLVASGGEAALTLIAKLTADERKLLAKHIRQRAERGRGEGRDGKRDDKRDN